MANHTGTKNKKWRKSIAGQRFGMLTAIEEVVSIPRTAGGYVWHCQCDCGGSKAVVRNYLIHGNTKSCGCINNHPRPPKDIPEKSKDRKLFNVWMKMRGRCKRSPLYRGRVFICERWDKFDNFLHDMGPTYQKGLSLDRRDNDGDYDPSNCRWADAKTQGRNTRRNRLIEFRGKTQCLSAWAEELGINQRTLWRRLYHTKMTMEQAVTLPMRMGIKQI